jgi:microcin C transport system substrate-binding protein
MAPDREELIVRTRALDRVLLHQNYMIPNWHLRAFWIAYWDRFGRPPRNPKFATGFPDSWWLDAARDSALAEARRSL